MGMKHIYLITVDAYSWHLMGHVLGDKSES